jgi:translation initiation factor IF-2
VEDFLTGKLGPATAGELEVLAVFNQEKLDKQLIGGRVEKGTFRAKASFEILRGSSAPKTSLGTGRALSLREKKSEIATAEKGKEIGILASSQIAIQVGDTLVIHK